MTGLGCAVLCSALLGCMTGLGWAGLGWAGLGWAGLGWAGLGWAGPVWAGLGWAGLGWAAAYPCMHVRVWLGYPCISDLEACLPLQAC